MLESRVKNLKCFIQPRIHISPYTHTTFSGLKWETNNTCIRQTGSRLWYDVRSQNSQGTAHFLLITVQVLSRDSGSGHKTQGEKKQSTIRGENQLIASALKILYMNLPIYSHANVKRRGQVSKNEQNTKTHFFCPSPLASMPSVSPSAHFPLSC